MRSKPTRSPATEAVTRAGAHDERPLCLACGAPIGSSELTIKIRSALVHMRCAAYRRRVVRR
jgi:hypothetical protein